MSSYTKSTNFAAKDSLPSGNPGKIVKGTEIDTEFNNIATAVNSKADSANPVFTGVVELPDGSASAPSLTNTGDTNTGVFFPAGDTIGFANGGSETARIETTGMTVSGDFTANGNVVLGNASTDTLNVGNGSLVKDSSGNLGLGVTPSVWNAGGKVVEIGATGLGVWGNSTANFMFVENAYYNGGWKYASTNGAAYYQMLANSHVWFTAPSGTAGNAITFTQAMTLDASGNLVVGNTSVTSGAKFQVDNPNANVIASVGKDIPVSLFSRYNDNPALYWKTGNALRFAVTTDGVGTSGFTEYARIDSSGNLGVGANNPSAGATATSSFVVRPSNNDAWFNHANGVGSGTAYAYFSYNSGAIGSITQNGTTAVAYNTTSDHRLKTNVVPLTGALAKVQALKPCEFDWIDNRHDDGFIAHELQAVLPNVVTGEKDAVDADGNPIYQQVDYSRIVATLTAAIQEQQAIIEQLKADVAALKGK